MPKQNTTIVSCRPDHETLENSRAIAYLRGESLSRVVAEALAFATQAWMSSDADLKMNVESVRSMRAEQNRGYTHGEV